MAPKTSIITLTKDRNLQLANLIEGLERSRMKPDQLIIVHMNEVPRQIHSSQHFPIYQYELSDEENPIPLAKARNLGARRASFEHLLFLDVDCIPAVDMIEVFNQALTDYEGIHMGHISYTSKKFWESDYITDEGLIAISAPHPARQELEFPLVYKTKDYALFWSLCFCTTSKIFNYMGGFDEKIIGYGGEDTDFGFKARSLSIPLYSTPARCFHQYHKKSGPPKDHLSTIVSNANYLYQKWGVWVMEGWLQHFEKTGLIKLKDDRLVIV
jgi:GT2 family glycosyltransferase